MTELRRRMREDLQLAGYSPRTQKAISTLFGCWRTIIIARPT